MTESTIDETKRLATLHALGILDTLPDAILDGIVRAAAALCNTSAALVSLVDSDRQWFKANFGLEEISETPRNGSFCTHTIRHTSVLVIEDARKDERFRDNPLVTGGPRLIFYAGAPLIAGDGARLGSLCVLDSKPGSIDEGQRQGLARMAAVVVERLTTESTRSAAARKEIRAKPGRREKIVLHARDLLVAEGATAFSVRKVAQASGMSLGHLQHYFPDKAALLDAILELFRASFNQYFMAKIDPVPNPVDRFAACARFIVDQGPDEHMVLLLRELWSLAAHEEKVARCLSIFYADCRKLATRILREANPELDQAEAGLRAASAISLLSGAFVYLHPWTEESSVDGFREHIMEHMIALPFGGV